ncbi:hypothetical protein [Isoptericola croceus]|uniref:hypothetical protein n=1 Tax=Isoptericola croceus TaxID=3031406 RepID=UPI0023F91A13|nr:hypothetical protein [Isoptericola croceus]
MAVERLVHDAVQAVPGVVRLTGGRVSEYATYLPGERIAGVRVAADVLHVHVVLQATGDLRVVADRVHETARQVLLTDGRVPVSAVHVHVDDVELDPVTAAGSHDPTGKERT